MSHRFAGRARTNSSLPCCVCARWNGFPATEMVELEEREGNIRRPTTEMHTSPALRIYIIHW